MNKFEPNTRESEREDSRWTREGGEDGEEEGEKGAFFFVSHRPCWSLSPRQLDGDGLYTDVYRWEPWEAFSGSLAQTWLT